MLPTSPRVGLVLGGGGAVGAAYHAGALAAIEHDLGWDARNASAVRRRDCRRTVFGPDEQTVSLSAALAASCAVPGYFAGVTANGDTYLDGGVVSATNADLLAPFDLDVVIVVSPMTGDARRPSLSHLVRRSCRRTLDAELRTLRDRDLPTVVIEPSRHVTQHMAMDFMSERCSAEIVRGAFFDTGSQIRTNDLLRGLQAREVA